MGYYIETAHPLRKAKQLVEDHGASLVLAPHEFDFSGDDALICVVENGPFDAAGIAYDAIERDSFARPDDPRARTWLSLSKSKVKQLCPQVPL